MLGNVQNNHKITINILGGSDYFISKQAYTCSISVAGVFLRGFL